MYFDFTNKDICILPIVPREDDLIYVVDLDPRMFLDNYEILNKYFRFKDHALDRFHIPELTEEMYDKYICSFYNVKSHNLKLDTASDYYKRKVILKMISEDLGISEYDLSLKEYLWEDKYYECTDWDDNIRYLEDLFREESKDRNDITAKELYISSECCRKCNVDMELWNELYTICVEAIQLRIAMIFEIPGILSNLVNILEYTDGFSNFATQSQVNSLYAIKERLLKMFQSKELIAWIKEGNNDYTLYAEGNTRNDYISTYRNMLKKLEGLRPSDDSAIVYYKDIIHNDIDKLEKEILEGNGFTELEVLGYLDRIVSDEEDSEESEEELVLAY